MVISPRTQRSIDAWAGNVLRVVRAKTGLTQRQLAAKAGVPYSTIAKIESGARQPTHPTMAKILAAVNLSLSTRVVPYDDHDDVLWELEQRRSPSEGSRCRPGRRAWLAREYVPDFDPNFHTRTSYGYGARSVLG